MEERTNADIIREITDLTMEIKQRYPELYKHLTENTSIVKDVENPEIKVSVFEEYLESLKKLIKEYREKSNKND